MGSPGPRAVTEVLDLGEGRRVRCQWRVPPGFIPGVTPAVVLAHGAGNGMDSPFMRFFEEGLSEAGLLAVVFNFPYREAGRRAPDRPEVLELGWRAVIERVRGRRDLQSGPLFVGGKSMGGRIATRVAAAGETVQGLVLLGYPLHPAGRPERLRAAHLSRIRAPMLFVQGSRDPLCDLSRLRAVLARLAGDVSLGVIEDADHSLEPTRGQARTRLDTWSEALEAVLDWLGPGAGA